MSSAGAEQSFSHNETRYVLPTNYHG